MKNLALKLLKRSGSGAASFKAILSILFAVVLLLVSSCSDPSNPANTGTVDNTSQNGDNPSGGTDNPSTDNPSGGTDNPSTDNPSTDNSSGNGTKNNPKIVEIQASQLAAAIQNYTAGTYTIYKVSGQMTDADYNSNITLINETLRNKWNREEYVGLDLSKVTGLTKVKMITNLSSLTIPDTVTNVGFDRLFGLQVLPDNPNFTMEDGVLYSKDKTVLYYYSKDKKGKSFEIPSGVKCIRNFAFEFDTELEEITIPESVIDIGMRAFYDQTLIFKNKENWISDITGKILTAEELETPDSWIYFDMQTNVSGPCRDGIYKPVTKTVALENLEEEINSFKPNSHTIFKVSGQVTNEQYSQICRLIRNKCNNEGWAWDQKGYIGLDLTETTGLTTLSGSWDGIFTLAIPDSVTEITYMSPYTIEKIANLSNHPNFIFEDGVLYSKDKKTLYSYSLNKEDENFEIPSGVELIWEDAFTGNNKIKNITIPASVGMIWHAFDNSSIQSLVFEDKEGWFFFDNDGKEVSVNAEDLENVENYRWNSQSQKSGIFQDGLIKIATKEISASQLKGEIEAYNSYVFTCYKVTGEMTNEQFRKIGELVEQKYNDGDWIDIQIGLDLSAVTGLTVIRNYSLFRLVIPESFVPNAASSFWNVIIPASNKNFVYEDGVLYSADKSILCRFAEDNTKESFVIPSTVKIICEDAFYNIPNIKNITIPESVTYIGFDSFYNSNIQTLNFANKDNWMATGNNNSVIKVNSEDLEKVENYRWNKQSQTNGIYRNGLFRPVTKTVTADQLKSEIESYTAGTFTIYKVTGSMTNEQFNEVSQLVSQKRNNEWGWDKYIGLDLSAVTGLTSFDAWAFFSFIIPNNFVPDEGCSFGRLPNPIENPNFVYEDGVLYSADKSILYRFDESGEKESFVIPSTVTKIWRKAFWDIRNLKSITIPQSVTYIGNGAFENRSLETLTFASKENWKTVDGDANVSAGDLENIYSYKRYDGVGSGKFLGGIYKSE